MAVKSKSAKQRQQSPEEWISGAPDGQAAETRRETKRQITLTITPSLIAQLDRIATRQGLSRAAAINQAIYQWVRQHEDE